MDRLLRTLHFAAGKHRLQKRKDGVTPYINHPIAVAEILVRVGKVTDLLTLQGGLLHDTLEDTPTTVDELTQHFGETVARLVQEVTDDKSLPKATRKQLQIEKMGEKSLRAKTLKLADMCCNVADLLEKPPLGWSAQRCQEYLLWCRQVMEPIRGSNPFLENHLDNLIDRNYSPPLQEKPGQESLCQGFAPNPTRALPWTRQGASPLDSDSWPGGE
ncbi:MAG: bifunctional (p)ppGpp synthetase/guanosine-3',5'-bis(diphosphate) 3'-pyrophosphohydrolase [Magnetococcales bacterium]|nr:bifunctional (p)ppGpp synthetase/guanosine-3',5'-bis(diphosphate) 3'-pyrophosphohydrolase [Magnetococcales bacterium]